MRECRRPVNAPARASAASAQHSGGGWPARHTSVRPTQGRHLLVAHLTDPLLSRRAERAADSGVLLVVTSMVISASLFFTASCDSARL